MLGLTKLFAPSGDRVAKKMRPMVESINSLEPDFQALSDEELRAVTDELKERFAEGESLDELLPEAFAAVREASRRSTGLRHFDVQLIGGAVLHEGKVAEMKTGEGKTLVATLPVYLNALAGKGVHVVTVNDYLARRDVQWMGPIYHALGLTVSSLQHEGALQYDPEERSPDPTMRSLRSVGRKEAYQADVTYGTNHDFGFDFLRDNMAVDEAQVVQRGSHYAIVDEVDYILIDEARTPLIISGPAQESTQTYSAVARLIPRLEAETDYTVEEKHKAVSLTDDGMSKMERLLNVSNLYDPENSLLVHHVENALRAHVLYRRDRDYVINGGQVIIVDEFTGRLMEGRRYGDGLHQAIEAKEGVRVQQETLTYASVTLQNYFRMYDKLAGMTGTAITESEELGGIYGLEVVLVPTHQPMVREDHQDYVYKTSAGKWQAAVREIEERHKQGQPALVGTTSIENSEYLGAMLKRRGVPHQVLNAKQHDREAAIVAQAGRVGSVTVATNMAGRGTDIILGGNPEGMLLDELRRHGKTLDTASPEELEQAKRKVDAEWQEEHGKVVALGGLFVLGTEKHEARRIDNQLRGRSGRQGDPGESVFYAALDDDLMRRFGGDRIKSVMDWAGLEEDQPLENKMVTKILESSQSRVEGYHFEIRKHLVQYDDVINTQRDVIYGERRKVLQGLDLKANVLTMVDEELTGLLDGHLAGGNSEDWDLDGLVRELRTCFPLPSELQPYELRQLEKDEIQQRVLEYAQKLYKQREEAAGEERMRQMERFVMLRTIDSHWVMHLTAMENLRQGVGLHAYGQRDPLVAYRMQAHEKFSEVMASIRHDIVRTVYLASLTAGAIPSAAGGGRRSLRAVRPSPMAAVAAGRAPQAVRPGGQKVGRNDPCHCGSGKKFKRCHGATA